MMNVIPEIALALTAAAVILMAKALRPRPSDFRRSRSGDIDIDQMRARLIAACIVFAVISMPLILRVVPPNPLYGFRTRATQTNAAIWYAANAFNGWALLAAAATSATMLVVLPTVKRWLLWAAFLMPILGAMLASFAYLSRLT